MNANAPAISAMGFIGFGLMALALYTARLAWFASASRRWPTTVGRMLFSGIHPGRGDIQTNTYVHYSYVVDGVTYESKRLRFGLFPSTGYPLALASSMQGRARLRVHYDPRKPSRSCLLTGLNELTFMLPFLLMVLGMLFMAADIFIATSAP
jgi:hypothetical protein